MDCQRTREQLGLLLDGELTLALSKRVLGHLNECGECRAELDRLRSIGTQLRAQPVPALGGLRARIVSEAMAAQALPEPARLSFAVVWPRAVALLLGAASVAVFSTPQSFKPQVERRETISTLDRVTLESQVGLELAGLFGSSLRELEMRPEGRLIFEVAGASR